MGSLSNILRRTLCLFLAWCYVAHAGPIMIQGPKLFPSAGGAPSGNAWTFVALSDAGSFTVNHTVLGAGNLLVIAFGWENTGTIASVAVGAGSGTLLTQRNGGGGDAHVQLAYFLATAGIGLTTITATPTGTCDFKGVTVMEFSATGTHAFDTEAGGAATGTSIASSAFTTATVNGLSVASYKKYSAATLSAQQIGGTGATRPINTENELISWYLLNSSQISSGTATATLSLSTDWTVGVGSFKSQ